MDELRFDGRVAIVTGAGSSPGLGRSYARCLAGRGANVLVNDVASDLGDDGLTKAQRVAREVTDDGGVALPDHHSVSEPASAKEVVATALEAWGRVDILVNNAGFIIPAPFDEITDADIMATVQVHLLGHIWMVRSVWPAMVAQHYGRILNTSSGVMLGMASQVVYGASKGGVFSLTRGLAIEGADHGIIVNTLSPSAGTEGARSLAADDDPWMNEVYVPNYSPDLVAPTASFLVHESVPVTAGWFSSSGGHILEGFFSRTAGIDDRDISIEGVRDRFSEITDRAGRVEAADPIAYNKSSSFTPKPYVPRN